MAKARSRNGGLLAVLLVCGFILYAIQSAPGLLVILFLLACGGFAVFVHVSRIKSAKQAVMSAVNQHMPALVRRRTQLVTVDAYGKAQSERWLKEIQYFYETQVSAGLSDGQKKVVAKNWNEIVRMVQSAVSSANALAPAFSDVSVEQLSPYEFEGYCAAKLRENGWDAAATKGSGDQGVDVIASRGGIRVVLQCKLYASPVGNKAVQEVATGRVHYGAQRAAVVSNRPYTRSAEQLAQTNGVLLLHYTQLDRMHELVGCASSPAATNATGAPVSVDQFLLRASKLGLNPRPADRKTG